MVRSDLRSRLQHVKLPPAGEDLARFPDFLIVGPQRTGTTWLHAHLRFHPQIFLSEPKEIFFFSRLKTPAHPGFQSAELEWYLRFFRDPPWRWAGKTALSLWRYRELYRPLVRGEATASYAALDRDVIAEVAALNPDVKAIMMIRDPVERAWSHAKKDLVRRTGRRVEEVPAEEFESFFRDEYQRRCARMVENFENWSALLKPGNVHLGRFADVETRPAEMLLEVMRFLGVRAERRYVGDDVGEQVNPTAASRIPERYRRCLEELLRDDIAAAQARFGPLG